MSNREIEEYYPNIPIPFPNFIKNFHNIQWKAGDWTDDNDQQV